MCGDQLTVYLNLNSDNTIEDISFEAKGCAISVASASIMSEVVKGKSVDEVGSSLLNISTDCAQVKRLKTQFINRMT